MYPQKLCTQCVVVKDQDVERGVGYIAAGGHKVADKGYGVFVFQLEDGSFTKTTFRVGDITRPLQCAKDVCNQDYKVVLDNDGSFMQHKKSKRTARFRRERNVWILDAIMEDEDHSLPFHRQA